MCACNYTGNVPPAPVIHGRNDTSKPSNQSEELAIFIATLNIKHLATFSIMQWLLTPTRCQ